MNFITELKTLCTKALELNFGEQLARAAAPTATPNLIEITPATQKQFGHYQCNSAMKLSKLFRKPPREIATAICDTLLSFDADKSLSTIPRFEKIEIAGPGFINFTFSPAHIEQCVNAQVQDPRQGVKPSANPQKVIIDFSSPNIAKEMHVGHLRSTIIGDCIAKMLTFAGHNVLRLNHVGDWGTQFGMLITYLKQNFADPLHTNLNLSELLTCYKQAKLQFDAEPEFKAMAQQEVVKLQAHDPLAIAIWQEICHISSIGYREIYALLDIEIIDRGESFYNDLLPQVVAFMEQQQVVQISDGAKCVFLDGFTNRDGMPLPLIIQKADGGYNYATTDLAAIYHRTQVEHGQWLIYVVDSGQSQHLEMVFAAARKANLCAQADVKLNHVPFGLVLGADGKKFRTRSGETEKLIDLITTAIEKAKSILSARDPNLAEDELQLLAKQLGVNAIKYADLANNRTSDYTFSYDRMLQFEGNTAAFLSYAYVRIQSIKRKIAENTDNTTPSQAAAISLQDPSEIDLAMHLCQFEESLQAAIQDLLPNRLTEYLFHLSEKFHVFFHHCRVEGSEQQASRLMLCEATAQVLVRGFELLGLTPLARM